MKPRSPHTLPPLWLLVKDGPPGLCYVEETFETQAAARGAMSARRELLRKAHRNAEKSFEKLNLRIVPASPHVHVCEDPNYVSSTGDLLRREHWVARNGPLLVEAQAHATDAVAFTWRPGRSRDPLAPRLCGRAPLPLRLREWPSCPCCRGAMMYVGTLDFRETPARASVPGDALTLFFCAACGVPQPTFESFWLRAHARNRLIAPPPGHSRESRLGTPWLVRDFRWRDVHRFWQLEGITNSVAGKSFYLMATVAAYKVGGHVFWIQYDETPSCRCGKRMRFACQFLSPDDWAFGDSGIAYVFVCKALRCQDTRVVLQCF